MEPFQIHLKDIFKSQEVSHCYRKRHEKLGTTFSFSLDFLPQLRNDQELWLGNTQAYSEFWLSPLPCDFPQVSVSSSIKWSNDNTSPTS